MPGSTPNRGYQYPLGPEQAIGSMDIQTLAEDVDADVASLIPAGAIMAWAGAIAPPGWQLCDGTLLARSGFSRLFAAIGTQYGEGDGVSTFATPNLSGKVIVAAGGGYALNATGGEAVHALTDTEMPSHAHGVNDPSHGHSTMWVDATQLGYNWGVSTAAANVRVVSTDLGAAYNGLHVGASTTGISIQAAGGSGAHNNMQPYLVLNYIIKL